MAENSKIEWTDHTFNPWIGCTAVSPACDHCYAEAFQKRCGGPKWGKGEPRRRTSPENWKQPLRWNRKAAKEGRRMRVFCASLADVFDAEVPDEWRDDLFALIAMTPELDWLLLTKRPAVARKYLTDRYAKPAPWFEANHRLGTTLKNSAGSIYIKAVCARGQFENVWLGTTVENQAMAEARIPHLLATPAAVRFLSCEPLLGPVDLTRIVLGESPVEECFDPRIKRARFTINALSGAPKTGIPGLDWVIVGGESGPRARPMHPDWARSLRDQCAAAGVPFLMKQWGEWAPVHHLDCDGPYEGMRRVGKKAAGRLLDGVLHDALPQVR